MIFGVSLYKTMDFFISYYYHMREYVSSETSE